MGVDELLKMLFSTQELGLAKLSALCLALELEEYHNLENGLRVVQTATVITLLEGVAASSRSGIVSLLVHLVYY